METTITIKSISEENLVDLFSTAFYGSTYLSADYEESVEYNEDACYEEILAKVLLHGGKIYVTDHYAEGSAYGELPHAPSEDDEDNIVYQLTLEDILRGLERAANGTFNAREDIGGDFADNNIAFARRSFSDFAYDGDGCDAITADCLMQVILFNEVVYG